MSDTLKDSGPIPLGNWAATCRLGAYLPLAAVCAVVQAALVSCIVMPWPLHAFWPLHELAVFLQALWPLQEDDFSHFTFASSPAQAELMLATVKRPATAVANAIPLSPEAFMKPS